MCHPSDHLPITATACNCSTNATVTAICPQTHFCLQDYTCQFKGKIDIGALLTTTSNLQGQISAAFAAYAVADINNDPSILPHHTLHLHMPVDPIIVDAKTALQSFQSMERQGVKGFVGVTNALIAKAVEPQANLFQVPIITNGAQTLVASSVSYIKRTSISQQQLINALAQVIQTFDWTRLTVVTTPESFELFQHLQTTLDTTLDRPIVLQQHQYDGTMLLPTHKIFGDARIFVLLTDPGSTINFFTSFAALDEEFHGTTKAAYAFVVAEHADGNMVRMVHNDHPDLPSGVLSIVLDNQFENDTQFQLKRTALDGKWSDRRNTLPLVGIHASQYPLLFTSNVTLADPVVVNRSASGGRYMYDAVTMMAHGLNATTHDLRGAALMAALSNLAPQQGLTGSFSTHPSTGLRVPKLLIANKQNNQMVPVLWCDEHHTIQLGAPHVAGTRIAWYNGSTHKPREFATVYSNAADGSATPPGRCLDNLDPLVLRGPKANGQRVTLSQTTWGANVFTTEIARIVLEEWLDYRVDIVEAPSSAPMARNQVFSKVADVNLVLFGIDRLVNEDTSPAMQKIPKTSPGFRGKYAWLTDTSANHITSIATDSYKSYQSSTSLWKDALPRYHATPSISGHAALSGTIPLCSNGNTSPTTVYPCRHDPLTTDCAALSTDADQACGVVFALVPYHSYAGIVARKQMRCFKWDRITLVYLNDDESLVHELRAAAKAVMKAQLAQLAPPAPPAPPAQPKVVSVLGRYPSLSSGGGELPNKEEWMPIDVPPFDAAAFKTMVLQDSDTGNNEDECVCSNYPAQTPLEKIFLPPMTSSGALGTDGVDPITVALMIFDALEITEDTLMTYLNRYAHDSMQRPRHTHLPSVRVQVAQEAACSWVRHEFSKGTTIATTTYYLYYLY